MTIPASGELMSSNSPTEKTKSVSAFIRIDADNLRPLIKEMVQEEISKMKVEQKEPIKEKTFTVKQAALEIGLSESTIVRRIKSGELKHSRVGKKGKLIRIKESDLKALLVERTINGVRG